MKQRIIKASLFALLTASIIHTDGFAQSPNPQAVAMYNLALKAYNEGSLDSAVIFFKRATEIDANLAEAQYNLGIIFKSQKRFKEAIPRLEEVIRIKPTDQDAHYQLAMIFQETGHLADAKQHFLTIAPNNLHFSDAQSRLATINNQILASNQAQNVSESSSNPTIAPLSGQTQNITIPGAAQQTPSNDQLTTPPLLEGTTQASQSLPVNPNITNSYLAQAPYATNNSQPATSSSGEQPNQLFNQPSSSSWQTNSTIESSQALQNQQSSAQSVASVASKAAASQMVDPNRTLSQMTSGQPATNLASANTGQLSSAPNPIPVLANLTLRVIGTGFAAPTGLAFDRLGNLYVANYRTNSIDRIGTDGTKTQFSSGANLKGPVGLVVDDSGNVYVANYLGGTVARITPAGVATIIATGFKQPYYLALDHEGNLYVSQQEDNSIVRISLQRPIGAKPQ